MEKYTDEQGRAGVWRTIRGRRVFIRDGEDLAEAMKRSGKFATKFSPEEVDELRNKRNKINPEGRKAKAREIDLKLDQAKKLQERPYTDEQLLQEADKLYEKRDNLWQDFTSGKIDRESYEKQYAKADKEYYEALGVTKNEYTKEELKEKYQPEQRKLTSEDVKAMSNDELQDTYNKMLSNYYSDSNFYDHGTENMLEEIKNEMDSRSQVKAREIDNFNNDINPMEEWSDTVGDGYSDAQRKAYKDYLLETQGTTDEDLINAGREPENRVSIDKFANEQRKATKSGNVTLPDGTPIDQNYVKDLYSGMSYEEVKRANDFDKEWMKDVKPEAKAMQMAKVEETDKYLASMERYESRISDEEYGKKDWGDGVYPFSEGTAWKGTKSGERLSTKEIAKAVTDKMKEAYPGVKIGRNTSYYSGGSSADFYITSSDKPIVRDISDFSQTEISRLYNKGYNSNYYHTEDEFKASIEKELTSGHFDINPYNIDDDYRLTPYGKQVVKDLRKVSDAYNYDESDSMTDYFNTGFYSDISIGKYNKPYVVKDKEIKAKVDRYKKRKGSKRNSNNSLDWTYDRNSL